MLKDWNLSPSKVAFDLALQAAPDELFDCLASSLILHEHALEGIALKRNEIDRALRGLPVRSRPEENIHSSIQRIRDCYEFIFYLTVAHIEFPNAQYASRDPILKQKATEIVKKIDSNKWGKPQKRGANKRSKQEKHEEVQLLTVELNDTLRRILLGQKEEILVEETVNKNAEKERDRTKEFRNRDTTPGGYHLQITPPREIAEEFEQLFAWYETERLNLHPIEVSAKFLVSYMRLYPYNEGAPFLARLLSNAQLMWVHTPPALIVNRNRRQYFHAIAEEADNMIGLYVEGIEASALLCRKVLEI